MDVQVSRETATTSSSSSHLIRNLLVATKAFDAAGAVAEICLAKKLAPNADIILMHNGMGVYERLVGDPSVSLPDGTRFYLGITTHGAFPNQMESQGGGGQEEPSSLDYYKIVHAGYGDTWLGLPPNATNADQREGKGRERLEAVARSIALAGLGGGTV
jgi:2-dehydropantoate 2-reductase